MANRSLSGAVAQGTSVRVKWPVARQTAAGVLVVLGAIWIATLMAREDTLLPPLWFLGIAAGFTLQRSRFCFASAFRDLFLFGSARMMKGILLGIAVATLGFATIMRAEVPFPEFGALPQRRTSCRSASRPSCRRSFRARDGRRRRLHLGFALPGERGLRRLGRRPPGDRRRAGGARRSPGIGGGMPSSRASRGSGCRPSSVLGTAARWW